MHQVAGSVCMPGWAHDFRLGDGQHYVCRYRQKRPHPRSQIRSLCASPTHSPLPAPAYLQIPSTGPCPWTIQHTTTRTRNVTRCDARVESVLHNSLLGLQHRRRCRRQVPDRRPVGCGWGDHGQAASGATNRPTIAQPSHYASARGGEPAHCWLHALVVRVSGGPCQSSCSLPRC